MWDMCGTLMPPGWLDLRRARAICRLTTSPVRAAPPVAVTVLSKDLLISNIRRRIWSVQVSVWVVHTFELVAGLR